MDTYSNHNGPHNVSTNAEIRACKYMHMIISIHTYVCKGDREIERERQREFVLPIAKISILLYANWFWFWLHNLLFG